MYGSGFERTMCEPTYGPLDRNPRYASGVVSSVGVRLGVLVARGQFFTPCGQKVANEGLRLAIVAFSRFDVAKVACLVDQVLGRPLLVAVGQPGRIGVVDRHRIVDAEAVHGVADVANDPLESEFGGVDAYYLQAGGGVGLVPGLQMRYGSLAVDARISPEVDQHDLAFERGEGKRPVAGRVEPSSDPEEARGRAVVGEQPVGRRRANPGPTS